MNMTEWSVLVWGEAPGDFPQPTSHRVHVSGDDIGQAVKKAETYVDNTYFLLNPKATSAVRTHPPADKPEQL